jgi:hypothetical protein
MAKREFLFLKTENNRHAASDLLGRTGDNPGATAAARGPFSSHRRTETLAPRTRRDFSGMVSQDRYVGTSAQSGNTIYQNYPSVLPGCDDVDGWQRLYWEEVVAHKYPPTSVPGGLTRINVCLYCPDVVQKAELFSSDFCQGIYISSHGYTCDTCLGIHANCYLGCTTDACRKGCNMYLSMCLDKCTW